jgi:hypothetical protein
MADLRYTHNTVPTQFAEANGVGFACRRFSEPSGLPLVFGCRYL